MCFYVSLRRCKSWSNKLPFFPESTTTFLVISAGEWMVKRNATWVNGWVGGGWGVGPGLRLMLVSVFQVFV